MRLSAATGFEVFFERERGEVSGAMFSSGTGTLVAGFGYTRRAAAMICAVLRGELALRELWSFEGTPLSTSSPKIWYLGNKHRCTYRSICLPRYTH